MRTCPMTHRMPPQRNAFRYSIKTPLFRGRDGNGVTDTGDTLPLESGDGGVEGPGGAEKDVVPLARLHAVEQVSGEYRGTASAARAAAVDVLVLEVEEHGPAVGVVVELDAVLAQQLDEQLAAQNAQIAGDDQVVAAGRAARVAEVGGDGGVGRGGRCSIRPIKFSRPLLRRHVLPSNQGASGIRPDI